MHHPARGLMVDMRKCKGRPSAETLAWRDDVTVPKYIRAGMEKLARLWRGTTSADSSATEYENRYFDTEREALGGVLV